VTKPELNTMFRKRTSLVIKGTTLHTTYAHASLKGGPNIKYNLLPPSGIIRPAALPTEMRRGSDLGELHGAVLHEETRMRKLHTRKRPRPNQNEQIGSERPGGEPSQVSLATQDNTRQMMLTKQRFMALQIVQNS
jgi:hypothetical protein